MPATLDSFASECRRILKAEPGPAGREQVRELVQEILKDERFVTSYINDKTPDRQVIYQDPELGFCICAHLNRDAKEANPDRKSAGKEKSVHTGGRREVKEINCDVYY